MRHAARVDVNQKAIVQAMRDAGAYVWIIGLPVDLLVGYKGHTLLMEVKATSKKRLTELQQDFFKNWAGGALCRVDSPDAALEILRVCDGT